MLKIIGGLPKPVRFIVALALAAAVAAAEMIGATEIAILTVVLILFDMVIDLPEYVDQARAQVAEQIHRQSLLEGRALQVANALRVSSIPADELTALYQATARVDQVPPFVIEYARQEVERCRVNIASAAGGVLTYNTERIDILIDQVVQSARCIEAVSFAHVDSGFWPTEGGKQYLEVQREAVTDRGVVISRIFIASDVTQVRAEIARHLAIGVLAYFLPESSVHQNERLDYGVFDRQTCYQSAPNLYGVVTEARLYTDPGIITSRVELFAQLRTRATAIASSDDLAKLSQSV